MKASTLFIITIAILLGVTAVVGAKYVGLFEPKVVEPEKAQAMPQVVVARQNLFEGVTLMTSQVRLRPLRAHELAHYEKNRDKYLPPLVEAAHLRVMARNVEADQPLLREFFTDQGLPENLSARLEPYTRAVNVSVPKNRAGGGVIQRGEHVDVYLTTSICAGIDCEQSVTRTAVLARDLKVIMKRNNLWTVMVPDKENTVNFTLQANPYRAALIEFAQQKGELALVPTPSTQVRPTKTSTKGGMPSFSDPESAEYKDEDERVQAILEGELTVGEADLERIFKLKPMAPSAQEPPPIRVVRWSGLTLHGTTMFNPDGSAGFARGQVPAQPISRPSFFGGNGVGYTFGPTSNAALAKKG